MGMAKKGVKWTLITLSIVINCGVAGYYLLYNSAQKPTASHSVYRLQSTDTAPPNLVSSYLVSGDVFWGRAIDYYSKRSPLKLDWAFSKLNEFQPQNYDGWVSDLECPVSTIDVPYQTQVDQLIFSCSPDYLTSAKKWFDIFTIANNHTNNTGVQGFLDTRSNLDNAVIQYFGHYDLAQKNDLCEVVSINAKVNDAKQKLPVAMCGYHWLSRLPSDDELAEITKYAQYLPVWVFAHGGVEYQTAANESQKTLYRKMIDAGADVVFGDHVHVIQDTEAYKGKLIVYSLGNLIFDQWYDDEVTKSLIVNIKIESPVDSNTQAWLDLAPQCVTFKDKCLEQAASRKLKAITRTYTYAAIAGDSSNKTIDSRIKHPASAEVTAWMLSRTKWAETMQGISKLP